MTEKDKARKVTATGEMALDIVFKDDKPVDAVPGGSALNAIVSLARAGVGTSFVSATGNDYAGRRMLAFLEAEGVDVTQVERADGMRSTVSLAVLDSLNNASYTFYRDNAPLPYNGRPKTMGEGDILLLSSFHAVSPYTRHMTAPLLEEARRAGAITVYDMNFRPAHKADLPHVMHNMEENMRLADIVRASSEDIETVFGLTDAAEAYRRHISRLCRILVCTDGDRPVRVFAGSDVPMTFGVRQVETVSTIGAGDNYNAGMIYALIRHGITRRDLTECPGTVCWERIASHAAEFAADCCTHTGNSISRETGMRMRKET